jgi:hypothetical protein
VHTLTYWLLVMICVPMTEPAMDAISRMDTDVSPPIACHFYDPPWLHGMSLQECRERKAAMADSIVGPGVRFECVAEE